MTHFRLLRWRATAAVLAVVLCAVGLASCSGTRPVAPLSVRANVVEAAGHRFVARGAVDYVLPFYDGPGGTADRSLARTTAHDYADRAAMFATMRRDGINVVRIPLATDGYRTDPYGLGGPAGYLHRLVATVHAARQAGLRVLLGWWDSLGWGAHLASAYRTLWPMVAAVLAAVGPDPDVFYEPYNEPNGIGWSTWQTVVRATLTEWRTVLHYRGVLVLDTIGYSWSFSPAAAAVVERFDAGLRGGQADVVFANHRYPNGSDCLCGSGARQFATSLAGWVRRYPIMGTEYGIYDAGYPPSTSWMRQMLQMTRGLEPAGFNGSILFVWAWVDPNSLTTGGRTLTAYGRVAEAGLWTPPGIPGAAARR